jgi:TRAP-type mannitol/chloroaromatic compound transport system permease small subunit
MQRLLLFIDELSMWSGKAFAWCILVLTFATSYEVFVRYVLKAPTTWAFDISYILYGALFLMAGAYTVSRDGHVRGDVLYRLWPPPVQAGVDLVLYILFYFPGIMALIYSGYIFAERSISYLEVSTMSPASIPIYPSKVLIPIAGVFLLLQGIAESIRCIQCIQTGAWPQRLHDVEETETVIMHEREELAKREAAARRADQARGGGQ